MDACVARSSGPRLFVNGTGRREYMFKSLKTRQRFDSRDKSITKTYRYEESASKKPIPRVLQVVVVPTIDKYRPLIPRYHQVTTYETFLDPKGNQNHKKEDNMHSYLMSDQSNPAGHNKAPVLSWWKPRPILTLRANGGSRGPSGGAIQSIITPLRLLVSSDLALEAPFCIFALRKFSGWKRWCCKHIQVQRRVWCLHRSPRSSAARDQVPIEEVAWISDALFALYGW